MDNITFRYVFPPSDLVYREEHVPIVHRIATILDMHYNIGNRIDLYSFKWRIRNKKPYLVSFHARLDYLEDSSNYYLDVSLENELSYEVTEGSMAIHILDDIIGTTEMLKKVVFHITVLKPCIRLLRKEYIDILWNTVWNLCGGECYDYPLVWKARDNKIYLFSIEYKESKIFLYYNGKEQSISDFNNSESVEDFITSWAKAAKLSFVSEEWEMDTEDYKTYIQWLPRETLEDTIELL